MVEDGSMILQPVLSAKSFETESLHVVPERFALVLFRLFDGLFFWLDTEILPGAGLPEFYRESREVGERRASC